MVNDRYVPETKTRETQFAIATEYVSSCKEMSYIVDDKAGRTCIEYI
jgi:hypothetical protein